MPGSPVQNYTQRARTLAAMARGADDRFMEAHRNDANPSFMGAQRAIFRSQADMWNDAATYASRLPNNLPGEYIHTIGNGLVPVIGNDESDLRTMMDSIGRDNVERYYAGGDDYLDYIEQFAPRTRMLQGPLISWLHGGPGWSPLGEGAAPKDDILPKPTPKPQSMQRPQSLPPSVRNYNWPGGPSQSAPRPSATPPGGRPSYMPPVPPPMYKPYDPSQDVYRGGQNPSVYKPMHFSEYDDFTAFPGNDQWDRLMGNAPWARAKSPALQGRATRRQVMTPDAFTPSAIPRVGPGTGPMRGTTPGPLDYGALDRWLR